MKMCIECLNMFDLEDFHRDKGAVDGHISTCKACISAQKKLLYINNREKYLAVSKKNREKRPGYSQEHRRKHKYGMEKEVYEKLFEDQKGKCAICGVHDSELRRTLSVDHCHATKKVRGLLCVKCNLGLAHFKENIENLKNAVKYLKKE